MNAKDVQFLVLMVPMGILLIVWGLHGIINKDKIRNRAHYLTSKTQLVGGIMCLVFLLLYFLTWGFGR